MHLEGTEEGSLRAGTVIRRAALAPQEAWIASPGKLLCAGISAERAVITQSSRQLVGLSYFLTSPQQQQRTLVLGHLT